MLAGAASAPAHGDPPLAYLQLESLYPAVGNRPSPQVELQLLGLLKAASDRRFPIKVALVANKDDLAHHPIMLRRPQLYADTLVTELGGDSMFEAPLLVVTPHGFGVAGPGARGARPIVTALPLPGRTGDGLARAAIAAVRRIALADGHALPRHVAPLTPVVAPAVTAASPARSPVDVKLGVALGTGGVLLAVLLYRLRRRPTRRREVA